MCGQLREKLTYLPGLPDGFWPLIGEVCAACTGCRQSAAKPAFPVCGARSTARLNGHIEMDLFLIDSTIAFHFADVHLRCHAATLVATKEAGVFSEAFRTAGLVPSGEPRHVTLDTRDGLFSGWTELGVFTSRRHSASLGEVGACIGDWRRPRRTGAKR